MVDSVGDTTDGIAPRERWTFWKDTAMAAVDGTRIAPASPFGACRTVTTLASGSLADTASQPVLCRRPARRIARDGDDGVCLMALREGRAIVDQHGLGESALPVGDLKLFDLARPYTVAVPTPYRETRLYVPRGVFAERVGSIDRLVGLQIPASSPLADLFNRYLSGLLGSLPAMTQAEAEAGLDGVLHLLSGLVGSRAGARRSGEEHLSDGATTRLADGHIADLLGDPEFDPAMLARKLGVSRAKLYRAFSDRGGVATAIRNARLDRARRLLARPADRDRTLQVIAYQCGFSDYPTFARAFRDRFGMPPKDARGHRGPDALRTGAGGT